MSKLKCKNVVLGDNADTTKNFSINVPSVADGTLTIETEAGVDVLKVNSDGGVQMSLCPTFFVSRITSSQTISDATSTVVQYNSETFDIGSCFDSTTNFRHTPNVAGYYQYSWGINLNSSVAAAMAQGFGALFKNASEIARGSHITGANVTTTLSCGSCIVYMNGVGDYVDIRAFCDVTSGTPSVLVGTNLTYFSGVLARAA